MPAWLIAVIAALGGIGILGAIARGLAKWLAPLIAQHILEKDLAHARKIMHGIIMITEPAIRVTPTNIDDFILDDIVKPTLAEFEAVKGKPAPIPIKVAANIAKAMIIEKNKIDLTAVKVLDSSAKVAKAGAISDAVVGSIKGGALAAGMGLSGGDDVVKAAKLAVLGRKPEMSDADIDFDGKKYDAALLAWAGIRDPR